MKNILNVGIVGFSNESKYEKIKGECATIAAFDKIYQLYSDKEIVIVSGLTNMGIPKLAYLEAVKRGWKTVGIAPKEAENYDLFPVNEKIIAGIKFGDESKVFIDYIDIIIKIGGGEQSKKEVSMALEQDIPILNMDSYFQ